MKTVSLSLDNHISWRSPEKDLEIKVLSGDRAVLTLSKNGHDAEAIYLDSSGKAVTISAKQWYTIETLGTYSLIEYNKLPFNEQIADEHWRPIPRKNHFKN